MNQFVLDAVALAAASGIGAYVAAKDSDREILRKNLGLFSGVLLVGGAIGAGIVRIGDKRSFKDDFTKFFAASVVFSAVQNSFGVSTVTGPLLSAGTLALVQQ